MEEEPTEPSIPEETETTEEVEIFPYLLDDPASPLDVELAVAFMISEVEREKGGGLIRKTPEEFIYAFLENWVALLVYENQRRIIDRRWTRTIRTETHI